MNKAEFVDALRNKTEIPKTKAQQVLEAALDTIGDELAKGGSVSFIGFGTFATGKRAARAGRNPSTGETIKIAAAKTVKFVASKALKRVVNGAGS